MCSRALSERSERNSVRDLDPSPVPLQGPLITSCLAAVAAMDMPPRDKGTTTKTGKLRRQEFWCTTCRSTTFWNSFALSHLQQSPQRQISAHLVCSTTRSSPLARHIHADGPHGRDALSYGSRSRRAGSWRCSQSSTSTAGSSCHQCPIRISSPSSKPQRGPSGQSSSSPGSKACNATTPTSPSYGCSTGIQRPTASLRRCGQHGEQRLRGAEAPILYVAMIARGLWHAQRSVHYWERLQEVQQRFANYEKRRRSGVSGHATAEPAMPAPATAPAVPASTAQPVATPAATTHAATATQWLQPSGPESTAPQSQATTDTRRKAGPQLRCSNEAHWCQPHSRSDLSMREAVDGLSCVISALDSWLVQSRNVGYQHPSQIPEDCMCAVCVASAGRSSKSLLRDWGLFFGYLAPPPWTLGCRLGEARNPGPPRELPKHLHYVDQEGQERTIGLSTVSTRGLFR